MTIRIPKGPVEGPELLAANVPKAMKRGTLSMKTAEASLRANSPLQVFTLTLNQVAEGADLQVAHAIGWHYTLSASGNAVGAAELTELEGNVAYSHLSRGGFVESLIEGVRVAGRYDEEKEGDWELRLLRIPALYFFAVWMHGGSDILIPIAPTLEEFEALKPIQAKQALDVLVLRAVARLQMGEDLM